MRRSTLALLSLLVLLGFLVPSSVQSTPANCVKHAFVSAKAEQSDPSLIGPNEWNACHNANSPGTGSLPYGDTGQSDGFNWLQPGTSGLPVISQGTNNAPIYSVLGATAGGTGQSTFTTGDTLYASSSSAIGKLAIGSNGQCYVIASGLPSWGGCVAGGAGSPGATFLEFGEMSAPSTPSANNLRLYAPTTSGTTYLELKESTGQTVVLSGVLTREVGNPIKDIVNTTTETSLFTTAPTIKGTTLGTTRELRIRVFCDYLNNTGASRQLTIKLKYAGVTFATLQVNGASIDTTATRYGVVIEGTLAAVGATNAQIGTGWWNFRDPQGNNDNGVTGGAQLLTPPLGFSHHNSVGADSTADQTLDITAQHDNANANQSLRPYRIIVELL